MNHKIVLITKACLYRPGEIKVYGHYRESLNIITLHTDKPYEVVFCKERPDFYIKVKDEIENNKYILPKITCYHEEGTFEFENLELEFPFETCSLTLSNTNSAIVSTLCKNYSHRLDEWIQYCLKQGFSGIVIFNNGGNTYSGLNESLENTASEISMEEIAKKYEGKVFMVDFPYSPFYGIHWNNIQRASLNIGVNAFREKCKFISLTDADEFIYIPASSNQNIEDFLNSQNRTITMRSNILTNRGTNDVINNNVLELAKYVGEDKYTKTILFTDSIEKDEFIITPHEHKTQTILEKDEIIHYHCWLNERYGYNEEMPEIDFLQLFLST